VPAIRRLGCESGHAIINLKRSFVTDGVEKGLAIFGEQ
jgi:hypothetical protein